MASNLELVKPELWDSERFGQDTIQLYRYNSKHGRLYYRKEEERRIYYTSVTTALKKVMPTSKHLIEWYAKHGEEGAERMMEESAEYGTMMHAFNARFLKYGSYNFDRLESDVAKYASDVPNYWINPLDYISQLQNDLLSFMQFVHDYDIKPLAIEVILYNDDMRLAGAADIICEMNSVLYTEKTDLDKRKREISLIDEKSGRKGFWDSHAIQLGVYAKMWNKLYPQWPVRKIGNWSPKDWRTEPTYNYKDQTKNPELQKIPYYIELAKLTCPPNPSPRRVVRGTVRLGESPVGNINYTEDLSDIEKSYHENQE